MFHALSKEVRKRLWPHQDQAIAFAVRHLNENQSTCLIRMPTGTGKTGVIACLTRLAHERSSLVLTPWANLRTQMIRALESGFWSEVGLKPGRPAVVEMLPSDAHSVLSVTTLRNPAKTDSRSGHDGQPRSEAT
jgi:superfamily II DNA or RNA helicase